MPASVLEARRRSLRRPSSSIRASSDRRLARRASKGDRQAIATIFERYQQELYGFCLGLLGEPQDAQDALQNTMVKVLRALPGEEREISLRPWLYRIAHNEAVELRRRSHPTQVLDGYVVDGQSSVTEQAEQREQLQWLLRDLADLPERQRAVLVMRELSGLDFAEIGAALDTSGAVVRQSLYEARRNLEQMGHGRSMRCEAVARVISDADGRITRRRDIRAHLRDCPNCRRFQAAIGRREGVLAGIPPIPATAAAGLVQALSGGSGGSGMAAALTGGVTKSAGVYGALKAAGTIAVVAVIGTAAIQSQRSGGAPNPSPHHALLQARHGSSRSPSSQRVIAVRSAHAANPSHRFAAVDTQPSAPSLDVSNRRPRSSSSPVERGSSLAAPLSSADSHHQTAQGAGGVAGFTAEPASEKGTARASKPEKKEKPEPPGQAKTPPGQAKTPPGQAKIPPGQAKTPPGQAKTPPGGQAKTPPGQAKKQAKAEEEAPSSAMPPPVETELPAGSTEATQPVESPRANGKAKGHEK
jgi:RNA polymerase sigma factor (sigma-70 family)